MIGSHGNLIKKLYYKKAPKRVQNIKQVQTKKTPKHQCYQMQTTTEGKAWRSLSTSCSLFGSEEVLFLPSKVDGMGTYYTPLSLNHGESMSIDHKVTHVPNHGV